MYQRILTISIILLALFIIANINDSVDNVYVGDDIPKMVTTSNTYKYDSVIKIYREGGICSAVVVADNYALTAAHCVEDDFGGLATADIKVFDQLSRPTGVIANAAAMDNQRDIALITGDFRAFKPRPVDWSGTKAKLRPGMEMISCGFPAGQIKLYCTKEIYKSHTGFRHLIYGTPIFRGCSGGPVFSDNGYVIGVNSSVGINTITVGPVIGFLAEIGLEKRVNRK